MATAAPLFGRRSARGPIERIGAMKFILGPGKAFGKGAIWGCRVRGRGRGRLVPAGSIEGPAEGSCIDQVMVSASSSRRLRLPSAFAVAQDSQEDHIQDVLGL